MNHLMEWIAIGTIAVIVVVVKNVVYPIPYGNFYYLVDLLLTLGFGMAAVEIYRTNVRSSIHEKTYNLIDQFQKVLNLTYDAVFMFDPANLRFTYVNEAALRQTGYSRHEILQMGPLNIKPNFTEEALRNMVLPLVEGKKSALNFETVHRHKSGILIPVSVTLRLVKLGRSRSFFVAIVRDISEHKEVMQSLNESQRSLQLFFEQALDGIFFMTIPEPILWKDAQDQEALLDYVMKNQYISKLNQAMANQYGGDVGEMLGLTPLDLFGKDATYAKGLWRRLFDEGRLQTMTKEQRRDGTPMWIEGDYICLYDEEGRITGHFGIQRDVTIKKIALDDLVESEKRLELSIESAGQGTWDWNLRTNQVRYGKQWARMLGYTLEELEQSFGTWAGLMHPEDLEPVQNIVNQHLDGSFYRSEFRLKTKEGSYKWVMATGRVIEFDGEGEPVRMVGTHTDIDAFKQMQEELETLNAHLERQIPNGMDTIAKGVEDKS